MNKNKNKNKNGKELEKTYGRLLLKNMPHFLLVCFLILIFIKKNTIKKNKDFIQ